MAMELRWAQDEQEAAEQRWQAYNEMQDFYEWATGEGKEESPVPTPLQDAFDMVICLAFAALEAARRPGTDLSRCPGCHGVKQSFRRGSSHVPGCPVCGYNTREEEEA